MANFVSILGKVVPGRERVVLKNETGKMRINPSAEYSKYFEEEVPAGAEFIYEGPDRKACFELWKEGVEHRGQDFRKSPDFLELLRKFQYKSPKEYFKFLGIDIEAQEKKQEEKAAQVTSHELPAQVEAIKKLGGGNDTSGQGNERYGGFGLPKELS